MKRNIKDYLDTLTIDQIKEYLDSRNDIAWYKIRTPENFAQELNERNELDFTKAEWEQACLDSGIQNFTHFAYDFYDTLDENSDDPDLFDLTWEQMVEEDIEDALTTLTREHKLKNLLQN